MIDGWRFLDPLKVNGLLITRVFEIDTSDIKCTSPALTSFSSCWSNPLPSACGILKSVQQSSPLWIYTLKLGAFNAVDDTCARPRTTTNIHWNWPDGPKLRADTWIAISSSRSPSLGSCPRTSHNPIQQINTQEIRTFQGEIALRNIWPVHRLWEPAFMWWCSRLRGLVNRDTQFPVVAFGVALWWDFNKRRGRESWDIDYIMSIELQWD